MSLLGSSGWSQKPPLGARVFPEHPLARGLAGCWLLNEGGGGQVCDLGRSGSRGALTNMAPATDWVPTPYGWGLDFDAVDDYVTAPRSTPVATQLTVACLVSIRTLMTGRCLVARSLATGQLTWQLRTDNSNADELRVYVDSTSQKQSTTAADLVAGRWYHLAFVYDGAQAAASRIGIYVNGVYVPQSVTGTPPSSIAASTRPLLIGLETYANPDVYTDMVCAGVWEWDIALPPAAVASHAAAPFGMLRPPMRRWAHLCVTGAAGLCPLIGMDSALVRGNGAMIGPRSPLIRAVA